jgi:multiple sugar transport system substrate-binding protein
MSHYSAPSRRAAVVAATLVAGTLAGLPSGVAAQNPNSCDGVIDGPVTLNMTIHTGSNPGTEQRIVDAFNAGPGAELGVNVVLGELGETAYETQITAAAASGDLPDILDMDGPFLYNFAWNGFVRPIESCVSQEKRDVFLQSIIEQGTYDGQLYSLGSFESGLGLWAHKSALEALGARIPSEPDDAWTVEEFSQVLKDLAAAGHEAPLDIKWWYGAGEWRPYGFAPMIQSAGGDVIDRSTLKSADGKLNGPEAVGAFTTFQGWVNDGLIDLTAEDDSNFTVGPDGQPNTGDETPISWVGHWMYPLYSENLGDDLILLPLPDFGNGSKTGMGSWNWAATTGADGVPNSGDEADLDAVWAFIDFATSDASVADYVENAGVVPPTESSIAASPNHAPGGVMAMYITNLRHAHTDTTLEQSGAVPRPATAAYGVIRDAFSNAMADIVAGADVQATLDNAVRIIDQEIEDAGY